MVQDNAQQILSVQPNPTMSTESDEMDVDTYGRSSYLRTPKPLGAPCPTDICPSSLEFSGLLKVRDLNLIVVRL